MQKKLKFQPRCHKASVTVMGQIKFWFINFWIPLSKLKFEGPKATAFAQAANCADREYSDLHLSNRISIK